MKYDTGNQLKEKLRQNLIVSGAYTAIFLLVILV